MTDNSGDHLTLDLDPPEEGSYGQVLYHSHEIGPTEVLAPSWGGFLARVVEGLGSGNFIYLEDEGSIELHERGRARLVPDGRPGHRRRMGAGGAAGQAAEE